MLREASESARRNCGERRLAAACNSASGTATVRREKPSNLFAYSTSAASPRLRTASNIGRTAASASVNRAARRARIRPTAFASTIRIIVRSHDDLVQRIFDNALRARFLQPGDDGAHCGLIEDGVHSQP